MFIRFWMILFVCIALPIDHTNLKKYIYTQGDPSPGIRDSQVYSITRTKKHESQKNLNKMILGLRKRAMILVLTNMNQMVPKAYVATSYVLNF